MVTLAATMLTPIPLFKGLFSVIVIISGCLCPACQRRNYAPLCQSEILFKHILGHVFLFCFHLPNMCDLQKGQIR